MGAITALMGGRRSTSFSGYPLAEAWPGTELYDTLTAGNDSDAGVRVSTRSGLTLAALWRGLNLLGDYVGKLPLIVYRRTGESGKERAVLHPAYRLLKHKPNREVVIFHFLKSMMAQVLWTGRGNAYAYVTRNGRGDPVELIMLDPLSTYPVRADGELWYVTEVVFPDGPREVRRLPPRDVIHIKGLGFDGLVGYDVVAYMRQTVGLGIALKKHGSVFFRNGAVPGVVLERPVEAPSLSPAAEANIRKSFDAIHQGLDHHHRTAVLQEGTTAKTLSLNSKDAQFLELRQHEIREIAAFLGIPPHKLGDTHRTSYNSLEQENKSFLDDALDGWLVQFEQEFSDKLLSEEQKRADSHLIEFHRDAILRVDLKSQVEALTMEVNNGLLSPDEARAIRNRPPIPGGLGSAFRMPANHVVLTEPDADTDELAFKRDLVKQLIADGTIGDVVFNLMDGKTLLEEVNVTTYGSLEEPWLPIVAASGPLVSGDVITDPDGDIVGGDVDPEPASAPSDDPPAPPDPDIDPDGALRALANQARRRRRQVLRTLGRVLGTALGRVHRRVSEQARKAAGDPSTFVAFCEGIEAAHRRAFDEIVAPVAASVDGVLGREDRCGWLADAYFSGVREALLRTAECRPDELRAAVDAWAEQVRHAAAATLTRRFMYTR